MNAERFLREYPSMGEEIMRLNRELNNLIMCKDESYCTLGAQNITDMPRNATPEENPSSVEKAVIKLIDRFAEREDFYIGKINYLIEQQKMFERIWADMDLLSSVERRIIELRCFQESTWDSVCQVIHYSRRGAEKIYQKAISKLQDQINSVAF